MSAERERIYLTLTRPYMDALNHLVNEGIYMERQTVLREALRRLFRSYGIHPFYPEAKG